MGALKRLFEVFGECLDFATWRLATDVVEG